MNSARVLGVVPARLNSQRLARKPLHPLAGRPLIEWVWRRVAAFGVADAWVVATDAAEVVEVAQRLGARVERTSSAHESGTERVAEVAELAAYRHFEIIVNVQGDEPFVEEEHVRAAVAQVRSGHEIGTVATPLRTTAALHDPAVVKVTRRSNGAALYFSRAAIPHRRDGEPDAEALASEIYLRHIGIYAYRREALLRWVGLPEHPLERIERLEQLRPLAEGMSIGVALVGEAERGVDTAEDAARAEQRLGALLNEEPEHG